MEEKFSESEFDIFRSSSEEDDAEEIEIRKDLKKLDHLLKEVTKVAKSCTPKRKTVSYFNKEQNDKKIPIKLNMPEIDRPNYLNSLFVYLLVFTSGIFFGYLFCSSASSQCKGEL